ncbi:hypothetical protein [Desulfovibrio sp. JC010]|nr:hypothetical protein [Desulfovibrio sp. JC010]
MKDFQLAVDPRNCIQTVRYLGVAVLTILVLQSVSGRVTIHNNQS